jgi:hypothetical protein
MYLHLISVYDLLIYKSSNIHPEYLEGNRPSSCLSHIIWPPLPCPPPINIGYYGTKSYISTPIHISKCNPIHWCLLHLIRFLPVYYKHRFSMALYHRVDEHLIMYKLGTCSRSRFKTIYTNVPYICTISFSPVDFVPVYVHCHKQGLSIAGDWPDHRSSSNPSTAGTALQKYFTDNYPMLDQLCGNISYPPNNGHRLFQAVANKSSTLYGILFY